MHTKEVQIAPLHIQTIDIHIYTCFVDRKHRKSPLGCIDEPRGERTNARTCGATPGTSR